MSIRKSVWVKRWIILSLLAMVVLMLGSASMACADCYPNLPPPNLTVTGKEDYTGSDGAVYTRYLLGVSNWSSFPDELFTLAPDLPACGLNTDASRTWVDIYRQDGTYIYGFCALDSASYLKDSLWFAEPKGVAPPNYVYITLTDRRCQITYTSNLASPNVICNDNNPCTTDTYDPAAGVCVFTPIICDDGNACTIDTCSPATGCVHTQISCNDGNACTTDTCDPATGCVHTSISCNDNNACTTDSCNPAVGCVHTHKNCNDGNPCTTDTCDPTTGNCVFTPRVCNDGNPCTTDTCDPLTGNCVFTPIAGCSGVVDTSNNNFTMNDPQGYAIGGTNDVRFTWDGTQKTSVAVSGQVANASLYSSCVFFAHTWAAHDVAIYGPGTYTIYDGCAAGSPGCGSGNPITFTVNPGELGAHMLFFWNGNDNIDVVDVWQPNLAFGPSSLWTGACSSNPADKVWDHMSYDWNGDGINGAPMTDGPFMGYNINFNVMGVPLNRVVDTSNNNFTIIDQTGQTFGGTNDVRFTWDATQKTSVAVSGQVSNASLSSSCVFFAHTWAAHDMAIYGPGTYTIYDGCAAGSPGCGSGNPVTFTVNPGELGAHMLMFWNGNDNIDVVDVWQPNTVFAPSVMCDNTTAGFVYGCGTNPLSTVWDHMSYDWNGDGINGAPLTDGPFAGMYVNFNVMEGSPQGCSSDGQCNDNNACTADSCVNSVCVHAPIAGCCNTAADCNDNNFCTADTCAGNACVHTTINCNDNNACTIDTCAPAVGCVHALNVVCNDNNPCTTDTCDPASGGCVFTPRMCNDGNPCTTDTCDPVTGNCVFTPIVGCNRVIDTSNNNFTIIDQTGQTFGGTNDVRFTWDATQKTSVAVSGQVSNASLSSPCAFFGHTWAAHDVAIYGPGTYTIFDGCAAGSPGCGSGNPVTFTVNIGELGAHMLMLWSGNDNMDVVNVWQPNAVFAPSVMCDNTTAGFVYGCGTNPLSTVWDHMSYDWNGDGINGAPLTDGPFAGMYVNFNVMEGPPPGCSSDGQCNDNNACTTDVCDVQTGNCRHTPVVCDDGNACTTDTCNSATGACTFTARNCNDNNVCTDDSCDTAVGCVHTPNTAPCNDGNACTTNDVCSNGICKGTAVVCNDNNLCTTDTCNPATGNCVFTPKSCNDNNLCTVDTCDPATGACMHSAPTCISTTNNNFTMNAPDGSLTGGTNDVVFTWDGTKKASVAASGQVSNAALSSVTPFYGINWTAHDVAVYGPGTYTVYAGCPAGSPGCGLGTPITFTVAAGQLGVHGLFDWGASNDMDMVDVWVPNAVFGPSPLYTGPDGGIADSATVWDWMSSDWDGDGINGSPFVDGPFLGFNTNFNVMGKIACVSNAECNDNNPCTTDTCDPVTGACVFTAVACTSVGNNVFVQPTDTTTSTTPVNLTFATVTQSGITTLTTSTGSGPQPPAGLQLGNPATYYDLTTTAVYSGPIKVCINYQGVSFVYEADLKLFHYENGAWVDRTILLDTTNHVICASVTSLSPFAIFQPAQRPDCNDNNPCTTDTYDSAKGCIHTPVADGTACDDANPATINDICTSGTCAGTTPDIFSGFTSPVDNSPSLNLAIAGQTIPVKWRITDANGTPVSDPLSFKSLTSYSVNCDTYSGDVTSAIEEYSTGSSGLQYLGDGNWQFNWKTSRAYAGQCRMMVLTLGDKSTHTADFKFK